MKAVTVNRVLWLALLIPGLASADSETEHPHAERFMPGLISTEQTEVEITFSHDGSRVYFSRSPSNWGSQNSQYSILISNLHNGERGGEWGQPYKAPFSSEHSDSDPFVTPDGTYLYFISDRSGNPDIWRVKLEGQDYGEPERLAEPVNSSGYEFSPVVDNQGNLYFASMRSGGHGQGDIYLARPQGEGFSAPEILGPAINKETGEWNVMIDSQGQYMIIEASGRDTNITNSGDLYLSLHDGEQWSEGVNLAALNTAGSDLVARQLNAQDLVFASTLYKGATHSDIFRTSVNTVLSHTERLLAVNRSAHQVCATAWPGNVFAGCTQTGGKGPHEIELSPDQRYAYIPNHGVYPQAHTEAIEPDQLQWVNDTDHSVSKIDLLDMSLSKRFVLSNCDQPHGIAVHPSGDTLWVTCDEQDTVQELNAETGELIYTWPVNKKGVHEIDISPDGSLVATTNFDSGTVSLLNLSNREITSLKVEKGPEAMSFSSDGSTLYVLNALSRSMSVIDPIKGNVEKTVASGGRFPIDMDIASDRNEIWIANSFSHDVSVLDATSLEVITVIPLDTPLLGLTLSEDETRAFVTAPRLNQIMVINTESRKTVDVIHNMMETDGVAWATPISH